MASKAHELVAIPQVLDLIEVAGSVVSIDAISCQRAIATTLVERRADYVLALKQNQRALWEQVQAQLASRQLHSLNLRLNSLPHNLPT